MKKINIKLIVSLAIVIILGNFISIFSFASFNMDSANLYSKGDCGRLIKKDGVGVKTSFVVYLKDGKEYPAYCLDKTKHGVDEAGGYNVSINSTLNNVMVWKTIINGYPYKTPEELGCANAEEAFMATKMAVYTILYDYQISQFEGINEAGYRVVNAINTIVTSAKNSNSTKISSDLNLTSDNNILELDNINSKYISKTYKVTANGPMKDYNVSLNGNVPEDTIVTDIDNNPKNNFKANEKFKVLVPIVTLGQGGEFNIKVKSGVQTKPIFYGIAPNSANQDYAITGDTYEDGEGETTITYSKNETKLKIFKQDAETREVLPGAKFDLLDSEKNVLYTNLTSDENGIILINNLMPGTYYLKETKAPNNYLVYEDYIKLEVGFNEEISIIVNNNKGEKPTIEVTKNKVTVKQKMIENKLPKTGM